MKQEPEYIIGGTKVEIVQVWECRNKSKAVIDRIDISKMRPIRIGNEGRYSNGMYYEGAKTNVDLIKRVGRIMPLEEAQELKLLKEDMLYMV